MKKLMSMALAVCVMSQSAYAATRSGQSTELHNLLNSCKDRGITVDYEKAATQVFDTFVTLEEKDLANGELSQAQKTYTTQSMDKIYNETKDTLTAYLAGEKNPMPAVSLTSDGTRKVSGNIFVDKNGNPLISTGFGHFNEVIRDADALKTMGSNNIAIETSPSTTSFPSAVPLWEATRNDNCDADIEIVSNAGNKSLKITNRSGVNDNKYVLLEQVVPVDPSTSYDISFDGKSTGTTDVEIILGEDWEDRNKVTVTSSKTYDVKTYTTSANQYYVTLRFAFDAGDVITIDNIKFENSYGENAVVNGDFEEKGNYYFHIDNLKNTINDITSVAKKGYSVDLLLSPHYVPDYMLNAHSDLSIGSGYGYSFNINQPDYLKFINDYAKFVIGVTKGCDISSICLSNEPNFCSSRAYDFYNPLFKTWLSNKYNGSISKFNGAHGTIYSKFDDINIPTYLKNVSGYPRADAMYYEYMLFNEDIFAEWHRTLAESVKSVRDIPVHAKMQDYLFFYDNSSIAKTLFGTDAELFAEFCDIAGNDATTYVTQPDSRSVTMMWYDFLSSLTDKPVYNSEDHVIEDYNTVFNDSIGQNVRYELLNGAVHARGASSLWEWQSEPFTTLFQNAPDAMYQASKTMLDMTRLNDELTAFVTAPKDTAFFYSKASRVMMMNSSSKNDYEDALTADYKAVSALGHKTGFVTERMPEKVYNYETLIIPDVRYISEDNVKVIADFMRTGGRVIVDGSDSFKYTDFGITKSSTDRTYIKNNAKYVTARTAAAFDKAYEDWGLETSIATIGSEVASGIDMKLASFEGENLISITNLENSAKTVTLPDGYTYTNLYDMEDYNNQIVLTPYEPMLLLKKDLLTGDEIIPEITFNDNSVDMSIKYKTNTDTVAKLIVVTRDANDNINGAAFCEKKVYKDNTNIFVGSLSAKQAASCDIIIINKNTNTIFARTTVTK